MIRWLYDLGFLFFGIASLPHFLMRLGQAEDAGRLLRERFGFLSPEYLARTRKGPCLWIHGVSVGEILAVEKFLRLILEKRPDLHVTLTTVTPTGQRLAKRWEGNQVHVFYFPFDLRGAVSRFFETLKPSALLLVETEIWPNVLWEAARRQVPVGVVNGRISDRSFRSFRRFSFLFRPLLEKIDLFLVQTEIDRERLLDLGAAPSKVTVTGNMKLDAFESNDQFNQDPAGLRRKWGFLPADSILIGGSTHQGEEEILLRALRRLRGEGFPSLKLLLAPRHIERAGKVMQQARAEGFETILASVSPHPSLSPRGGEGGGEGVKNPQYPTFDVLILDVLGELRKLYAMGDAVFMGGSLVPHGGQNPVEPAALLRPVLHGPWVFNFQEIYRRLDEEGAVLRVNGEEELFFGLKRIFASQREREHLGRRAYEVLSELRGASERNFDRINQWIGRENYEPIHTA